MTPSTLEYFVMVARLGSISRAALELGIEQSTITRHIGKLETDIGMRLFHRSGRGVVLTDAGSAFLASAQGVVHALDQARQAAAQLSHTGPAQVVIAAQPTIAWQMFGPLAHALSDRFPGVKLHFKEGLGNQMINWLVEGQIDVALLYVPTQAHVVDFDELLKEPLYCVAAPDFSLPEGPIGMRTLLSLPMVLPSTQHGLRGLMESLAHQENIPLNTAVECDGSIAVTTRLVEARHGCTIRPLAAIAREHEAGLLKAVPVDDPRLLRAVAIATARNRPMVDANWAISRVIRQVSAGLVSRGAWLGVGDMQPPDH